MKIIYIGLWKQPIYLLWDSNEKEYLNLVKEMGEEDEISQYCAGRTNLLNNGYIIIYVRKQKNKEKMLLVLNHEIFHAVKSSLETRGVSLDEEVYAYTMEYVQKKCYNAIGLKVTCK